MQTHLGRPPAWWFQARCQQVGHCLCLNQFKIAASCPFAYPRRTFFRTNASTPPRCQFSQSNPQVIFPGGAKPFPAFQGRVIQTSETRRTNLSQLSFDFLEDVPAAFGEFSQGAGKQEVVVALNQPPAGFSVRAPAEARKTVFWRFTSCSRR